MANHPQECLVCKGKEFDNGFTADDFRHKKRYSVFTCRNCGAGLLYPTLSFFDIEKEYYNEEYHAYQSTGLAPAKSASRSLKDSIKHAVLGTYLGYGKPSFFGRLCYPFFFRMAFYPRKVEGGTYLDVGCGSGVQLLHMKELGWEPHGVDVSRTALDIARRNGIANLYEGTLDKVHLPEKKFDVVNMTHVLEHIPNPDAIIGEARRILKDDGTFIISVPNFDGLGNRIFGSHANYDIPRHIHQFTLKSLSILLQRNGFTVTEDYRNDTLRGVMSDLHFALKLPLSWEKYFVYFGLLLDLFVEPFTAKTSMGAQLIVKAKKSQ